MRVLVGMLAIGSSLLTAGCAVAPTATQQQSADYGAGPRDYESVVRKYFDDTLKDPGSIQFKEITAPQRGYMQDPQPLILGLKYNYGWLVYATVNAKNSYGGYVGFKTYTFLFRGEQIVDTETPE